MIGELISAGSSLLGGLFGKSSAEKANRENIKLQKEFAQQGIQWKVADAKAAGVHPLAALGANTVSFTPSSIGDGGLGQSIANMGQDIGRAVNATSTQATRDRNLSTMAAEETLKGLKLDNEGKAIQNAALASRTVRQNMVGAAFPSADGRTNTGIPGQASSKLMIGGAPVPVDPKTSPASDFEDRFGDEIGGVLAGVINLNQASKNMSYNQAMALHNAILGPALTVDYKPPAWLRWNRGDDKRHQELVDTPGMTRF
jgi:hypothetical protein